MSKGVIGVLTAIAPKILEIVDEVVLDRDSATELRLRIAQELFQQNSGTAQAAAQVIVAEAQGENWLQRNWRPLLMVWFSILVGAYWFGFVPINMPTEVIESMFTLIQIGVGGYVVGRSGEKIAERLGGLLSGSGRSGSHGEPY